MAETLDDFDFLTPERTGIRYPWDGPDGWLNGATWKLVEGVDYCATAMVQQCHAAARSRGLRIRTRRVPDGLVIRAYRPESAAA